MFLYDGIKVAYKDYGNKKKSPILFLHGWGQNIMMMEPIANPLKETNRLIIVDLPGFGDSDEPKSAWTFEDYAKMLKALLDSLKIKEVSIVGHSFGGKLALFYASRYKTKRLVLLASPFMVHPHKVSWKVRVLKRLAKVPGLKNFANKLKGKMGSTDYRNASMVMRNILVKHIHTDLSENAKKIKCPTLIIWGTNDTAVNIEDAYILEKLIPDSGLVVYEGCTHYAYLENIERTNAILKSFLSGDVK